MRPAIVIWLAIFNMTLFAAETANSAPFSLVCQGETVIYESDIRAPFKESGAMIDLESLKFHAPVYGLFEITRVDETTIVFGRETAEASFLGNLDRISGAMTLSLLKPAERRKLNSGQSAKFTSHVTAICQPAKRMF
jgi:hypothetical protein